MGVGAVTVNGVDLTSKADTTAFEIEFQANRLNGICKFRFKDDHLVVGGSALDVREQYELIVTDGGVRIYGGRIATVEPSLDGNTIYWVGSAVQFDTLLDERVIDSGLRDASLNRYDDDDVKWLCGFHAELVTTSYVSRLRTQVLPTIDYTGKTIRQALEMLSSYTTGPVYWVDENKQVHWTNPATAQVVQNPAFDSGSASNWALDAAAAVTADAGPGGTGDYALVTTGSGVGMKETTQTITGITALKRYYFAAWLYSSIASKAQVRLDWQNVSSVSQRIDVLTNSGTAGVWAAYKAIYTAPATATKVVIRLGGVNNFTGTVRHDNLGLVQETAAWGVDTTPDNSTTFAPWAWREPRKAVTPINRVFVQGNGISGWREHAASIAYYGGKKFEGYISDDRVTTTDGIDSRAAATFRKYAFPVRTGSYVQKQSGLAAGTWQIVNIGPLGQTTIEWIATLRVTFGGANLMVYEVIYGEPEEDLGAGLVAAQSAYSGTSVTPNVPDAILGSADTTPPAVPTGLTLTSDATQARRQPDGTIVPYLLATWTAVGDADLQGYELALDRAISGDVTFIASASGTGGTLPAGTYAVQVTGNGSAGGETGTTTAPQTVIVATGQRLFVNITAKSGCSTYRAYASILTVSEDQPKATAQTAIATTGSNVEITAAGAGVNVPAASTAVSFTNPTTEQTASVSQYTENVVGSTYYGARIRSFDKSGNYSSWSSIVGITTMKDSVAPQAITGLTATPGYRLVGLTWQKTTDTDIDVVQIRYTPSDPTTATDWVIVSTKATSIVITGLDAGSDSTAAKTYTFQARAVDRSGNCRTSDADATAVNANANPTLGWSNTSAPYVQAIPTRIGSSDIAAYSITADRISTVGLDAALITSGSLRVGGLSSSPYADFFLVYNASGQEIGRWDQNGLTVIDPATPTYPARAMRFLAGKLQFANDYDPAAFTATWTTAIDYQGITADSITLGTAPGGHNAIPNASFELAAFTSPASTKWTDDTANSGAGWASYIATTNLNVSVSGVGAAASLVVTAYT